MNECLRFSITKHCKQFIHPLETGWGGGYTALDELEVGIKRLDSPLRIKGEAKLELVFPQ